MWNNILIWLGIIEKPEITKRHDNYPALTAEFNKYAYYPIPKECLQPHEYDAFFSGHWEIPVKRMFHIRDCRHCRLGMLISGAKNLKNVLEKQISVGDSLSFNKLKELGG